NGGDKKTGYLILRDGQSREAAILASATDSGNGLLRLYNTGAESAYLGVSPDGGSQLRITGDGKNATVGLNSFKNGSATFSLNLGASNVFDFSSSLSNGSLARFYNPGGKLAIMTGPTDLGSGFARYYDGDNERIYVGGTVD